MRIIPVLAVALAFNSFSASSENFRSERSGWDENGKKRTYKHSSRTALITFSGLWNGVNPYTSYEVRDHTRDAMPDGKLSNHELGGGVMFALGPCSGIFPTQRH